MKFSAWMLACMNFVLPAYAQAPYPAKPVRVISQFTPGGLGDVLLRNILDASAASFGQPFVVDAKLGADGIIAMDQCRRAPPDGYTLCFHDSFAIALAPHVRTLAFEPQKALVPVIHAGSLESMLLVHNSVPSNSVAELFALAKSKPNSITFSSFGTASGPHLYVTWLERELGVPFLEVPYKTASLAFQALLSGEVLVTTFSSAAARDHLASGRLRAIATNTLERSPKHPNLPTFKEAGLPLHIPTWFGLFAPAGTPPAVIERVNAALARSFFSNPQLVEANAGRGILKEAPAGELPDAFAKFLQQQRTVYADMARTAGLKRE